MARVYRLTDSDLPVDLHKLRDIFMAPPAEKDKPRQHNESLHDYLTRKGIKCACKACREERKQLERTNNSSLLLGDTPDSNSNVD